MARVRWVRAVRAELAEIEAALAVKRVAPEDGRETLK
jgi:hypothetical protein